MTLEFFRDHALHGPESFPLEHHMIKRLSMLVAVALLVGCSGITDVIQKRESLYGAVPVNAVAPAPAAYELAIDAARKGYSASLAVQPNSVEGLVDAGISAANSNCRAWLSAVSMAEARWRQGETNVGVLSALISGALAAAGVHRDVLTMWGLGSGAWQGYSQGFLSNVLGMADYDLQTKVREAMTTRARDLRGQASTMTYPQAIDAIDAYADLCTPQAAKALTRSALTAVTTTVAPSGAITTAPSPAAAGAAAALSAQFQKDATGDRVIAYWIPGNVVDADHESKLLAWMQTNGVNTSIPFFAHAKIYDQARRQAVADLAIPEVTK
jgi:hypothetical protein